MNSAEHSLSRRFWTTENPWNWIFWSSYVSPAKEKWEILCNKDFGQTKGTEVWVVFDAVYNMFLSHKTTVYSHVHSQKTAYLEFPRTMSTEIDCKQKNMRLSQTFKSLSFRISIFACLTWIGFQNSKPQIAHDCILLSTQSIICLRLVLKMWIKSQNGESLIRKILGLRRTNKTCFYLADWTVWIHCLKPKWIT